VKNNIKNNEQESLKMSAFYKTQIQPTQIKQSHHKLRNLFAASTVLISASLLTGNASAIEVAGNFHKGDESKAKGFSFVLADQFTKGGNIYWSVGYNRLDKLKYDLPFTITGERFFKVDTVDALVSYRHKIQSYNSFLKNLTIEYQLGASVALTENKLTYTDPKSLEAVLIYSSEKNDINAVIGVGALYKLDRNTSINFGVKYQPSFSEFGDISSAYVGLTYRFGRGVD